MVHVLYVYQIISYNIPNCMVPPLVKGKDAKIEFLALHDIYDSGAKIGETKVSLKPQLKLFEFLFENLS